MNSHDIGVENYWKRFDKKYDEVTECIKHHLPSIYRSKDYEKEGVKLWQCRECIRETDEMNKPVILEHDGIKEIMTTWHVDEVRKHRLEICPKCTHYRCICKFREIHEYKDCPNPYKCDIHIGIGGTSF